MLSVALCRDVLAIRCIGKYIIVGIGNQLHIFDELTLNLVRVIETFHQDVIHQIVRASDKLIVFGGRSLSVFRFQITNDTITIENESTHRFTDWIIAADFFSAIDCENVYILFAHNNLYLYNTLSRAYSNLWCEERCILYSGCISTENPNEAVVFSGTVFQEILIWIINNKKSYPVDINVSHRLKGHKGVIFSIFYDPLLHLITSTSDDRTVRLWAITDKGSETSVFTNWNNAEILLKTTMFGHTARVWKSIIVNDNIISIGEDSLISIWTLEGKLCNNIVAHDGATVWSIDISQDKSTIFTGGADGAVNSWPLIYNQASALIPTLTFEKTRTPKYVSYLKSGTLIVFLDGGELLSYDHDSNVPKESITLPRYESYCIMQICPNRERIALASNDGFVDIFEETNRAKLEINKISERVLESKIFSMQWLNEDTLLLCGDQGDLKVLKISQDRKFEVQSEFTLPPSRECWTTAAIIVENALVCGDRAGSVYVFSMESHDEKNPKQIFPKIHGRLGVQSFGIFGKEVISTGRDASLRYYKTYNHGSSTSLQALHWKKMPMEWVSRILKTDRDLYVLGFKEIEFMIYSTRLNRLVLRIVCGGGHRSWDCTFANGHLNFACIRNKQIYILENASCTFSDTVVAGYHTKEIHSLQTLPTLANHNVFVSGSEDCTLRIGCIIKSSNNRYDFIPLDTYDGHISSVKSIAVLNLENTKERTKNLVFSGGGRAQLKVWEVSVDTEKEKLCSDDLTTVELTTFMLRGTDKDRRKTWLNKRQPYFVDPETRFMDINAYLHPQDHNLIILFVACSDGFLRILVYDIDCNSLNLTTAIPYYNRCIIKVHTFLHEDELILISMATDGIINLWSVNSTIEEITSPQDTSDFEEESTLQPFGRWNAHQSGINSYDIRENNRKEYFLASGGDDNKLSLSIYTIPKLEDKSLSIQITTKWDSTSIHSAQITGIKFVGESRLLSIAIDQRIVMYCYSYNDSVLSLSPIRKLVTFVADVQGLTLLNAKNSNDALACIHGQGLDVILIENQND